MKLEVSINGNKVNASDVKNYTITDSGVIDILNQIFARMEYLDKPITA